MASELAMLSPMPRKWYNAGSPYSCFDMEDSVASERPFFYDVDGPFGNLLGDLVCEGTKPLPEWMPAFLNRSLSTASTTIGQLSPELDCCSSPCVSRSLSPELLESPALEVTSLCDEVVQPSRSEETAGGIPEKSLQVRKIFVGGIPQTIDQNELFKLFSTVSKVKKAWMQTFHQDRCVPNARKHRGFGFVIFADKEAVQKLLGDDFSRKISFGEGLELEVKRAVGKQAAASLNGDATVGDHHAKAKKSNTAASAAIQSGSPAPMHTSLAALQQATPLPMPVFSPGPVRCGHAVTPGLQSVTPLPTPFCSSMAMNCTPVSQTCSLQTGSMPSVPPFPHLGSPQPAPPRQMLVPCMMCPAYPNNYPVVSAQDMAEMLRQAQPEHYDD